MSGDGADGAPDKTTAASHGVTRRRLLLGAAGVTAAAAGSGVFLVNNRSAAAIGPESSQVAAADRLRRRSGRTVTKEITAAPATVDLGGRQVATWAYDGQVPGPMIRLAVGDTLRLRLNNRLPERTGTHWHGLAIRNDMDGVPGVTMPYVAAGGTFDYDFVVPDPGTYWYHSHVGLQLDRGLYGAFLVDAADDAGGYDAEAVLILDDWLDGTGRTPEVVLRDLGANGMAGMSMGGMGGASRGPLPSQLGGDAGDVTYPLFLINGRSPADPSSVKAKPGQRIRLRIINAGADTAFRFAVGGHRLSVTHADGFPVTPVEVDTLLIGMSERYDVIVTAADGVFPIVAYAEGKGGSALAVLRTGAGAQPAPTALPAQLRGSLLSYAALTPTAAARLPARAVSRSISAVLEVGRTGYRWTINGKAFHDADNVLKVRAGERVRITFANKTGMFHPMHLHGHTFALAGPDGTGVRKDTVIVKPGRKVAVELDAVNPGQWMVHCHNAYHQDAGMMSTLSYVA